MTGPVPGEPVRDGSATHVGTRDDVGGILILLALALTFRVIIAYLLPGSGFASDLSSFQYWAGDLAKNGLSGFYERPFFHDYTPGYLYVLWAVGIVGQAFGGIGDIVKVPPILGDLALAYLVWSMSLELGASRWAARLAALIVAVNPITWFDSVVWGQVDSVGVVFLLLGLRELWRDRPERSAVLTVIGAIIKPQLGILVPLVAAVTIRRALWPDGGYGEDEAPPPLRTTRSWETLVRGPVRIATTAFAGFATAVALSIPFGLSLPGLVEQIFKTAGGYPYLSVNAWNPWALLSLNGNGIAQNNHWACDMVVANATFGRCPEAVTFGAIPAVAIGVTLTLAVFIAVSVVVARRPDRLTMLVGLCVLALAFFVLPTRVHERYLFPFVAIGAILAAVSVRWSVAYVVSCLATLANMYFVLTTLYSTNPGIRDWLGIGHALGSYWVIAVAAVVQGLVFLFLASELRASATRRLADVLDAGVDDEVGLAWDEPDDGLDDAGTADLRDAPSVNAPIVAPVPLPPAVPALTTAATAATSATARPATSGRAAGVSWHDRPSAGEVGYPAWFRSRLMERPIRRDRSADLQAEGGGRLDRLDLWLVLVLAASLLTARVWRLGEPYQMIFDEVYHPRTGIEFLQAWRYGISHYIYEWTHPHLAKYAIAGGLVAWGDDRTSATSDLGVPVRAAVVEPRWDNAATAARVAGDRLWVATGESIRAYDLATRGLVISVPVPGVVTLAVDQVRHRVLVGTGDGSILTVATGPLDAARWTGAAPAVEAVPANAFATLPGSIAFLHVTPDGGTIVAATRTRSLGPEATAMTATVMDADSAAVVGSVALGMVVAIADAGTGMVALATPAGVVFVDVATATSPETVALAGPPEGMALTTSLDKDRLYVSFVGPDGPSVSTITTPGTGGTPSVDGTFRLPGSSAGWVGYDLASQMVHVLGSRPSTGAPTIYVIEPHSNAVYADAALPFAPAALVVDENQRYVATDRQAILALSRDGAAANVETGKHAFAWRLPGVLAGMLMAVLLYLLARLLFRRREVAVFLGIIVGLDGMLFAQSRIGMNDSYVGLGIVAAYLVFAALWRSPGGSRRHWIAFALGMPLVGVSLGIALAAKWVAAYAIGALGILVLARSALGRVLLVAGLILATTVLGYIGLSVPAGTTGGNYLFMVLMIGLTLAAVAVNVWHPIAWTDEEERLLVWGPAVAGGLIFLVALARGIADHAYTIGPVSATTIQIAFALVILSAVLHSAVIVVGRWGFGPRAIALPADDPARLLPPPSPAPEGWLRPGALLGLPMVWTVICLVAVPLALYVVSYIPWAFVEDHRLFANWPPGHTGQTLQELTGAMYRYHNELSSAHAASSPWWAWPFDFKLVWFYQEGFAGGTAAAVYDSGNLVAWWLAVPAMAFAAWQAFVRRSPALALVTIGFAVQWLAWARIDRAAFQYHYYTSLPFVFLALAYFLAELWQGASRRTWLLARLAGAAAVIAPTTLWLVHRPLCGFVDVLSVNPGSQACPTLIPDFLLTGRAGAIALVVGVGVLIIVRLLLSLADEGGGSWDGGGLGSRFRTAALAAVGVSLAFVVASAFFDDTALIKTTNIPVEPIALVVTIALLPMAAFVATARDARRFVVGVVFAMGAWFVLWYPNLSALPLPAAISNAYQGLLPTYVYPFQFPVSKVDRSGAGPALFAAEPALLLLAMTAVCLIVGYAVWVWRIAAVEATMPDDSADDAAHEGAPRA